MALDIRLWCENFKIEKVSISQVLQYINGFFALDVVELAIQLLLQITKKSCFAASIDLWGRISTNMTLYYCGGPTTFVFYNFLWEVSFSPKRPLLFLGQVWSAMAFMALMSPPTKHLIKLKLFGIPHNRGVIWGEIQPRRSFEAANHGDLEDELYCQFYSSKAKMPLSNIVALAK